MNDVMKQIKNPPKYVSPYEDLINESISNLINRDPFSYNPDEDAAYQAYKQRALAAGESHADNPGGMSVTTGGWVGWDSSKPCQKCLCIRIGNGSSYTVQDRALAR